MDAATTATAVRRLMERDGCSQQQLAELLGMSQSSLSRRLNGEYAWRVTEIAAIARRFDVPLAELVPHDDAAAA